MQSQGSSEGLEFEKYSGSTVVTFSGSEIICIFRSLKCRVHSCKLIFDTVIE